MDTFVAQGADVAAGVKQQLESDAARIGGLRLLGERFMVIRQAWDCRRHAVRMAPSTSDGSSKT